MRFCQSCGGPFTAACRLSASVASSAPEIAKFLADVTFDLDGFGDYPGEMSVGPCSGSAVSGSSASHAPPEDPSGVRARLSERLRGSGLIPELLHAALNGLQRDVNPGMPKWLEPQKKKAFSSLARRVWKTSVSMEIVSRSYEDVSCNLRNQAFTDVGTGKSSESFRM